MVANTTVAEARAKKVESAFETRLKTSVARVVKTSQEHAKDLALTICMSMSFSIFHGRNDYLNDLDQGLHKGDLNRLKGAMNLFNRHGAKLLFEGNAAIWDTLKGKVSKTGGISLFVSEEGKEITRKSVKDSEAVKLFWHALVKNFDEDSLSQALLPLVDQADDRIATAANRVWDFDEYLVGVIKTIARRQGAVNPSDAESSIKAINRIIHSKENQFDDDQIKNMIKEAVDKVKAQEVTSDVTIESIKEKVSQSETETPKRGKRKVAEQAAA